MKRMSMKKNNNKGFTLLELMVALTIFLMVLATAVSIFLTAVKSQREAFKVQDIQDSARYLMEAMLKELRMSHIISFDSQTLKVINQEGATISYEFDNSNNRVRKYDASFPGGQDISATQVKTSGKFSVMNGVYDQPRITINMSVKPASSNSPEVIIQSTVALREY